MRRKTMIAAVLALLLTLGCSSQARIIDSEPETEKIQIVGQIETAAPVQTTPEPIVTPAPTDEAKDTIAATPEPTEAPTEAPTEIPTEEPTAEPTEEPMPEPTEEPTPDPTSTPEPDRTKSEEFCELAKTFLDKPYHRGGTDPETGFDPGGFTYYCLNQVGVKVRHKTSKGYSENDSWQRVEGMDELEPGDLCFFMTPGNESVNCVCIYLGDDRMIYPSSGEGKVITAKITSKYWTEAFVFARRVF